MLGKVKSFLGEAWRKDEITRLYARMDRLIERIKRTKDEDKRIDLQCQVDFLAYKISKLFDEIQANRIEYR